MSPRSLFSRFMPRLLSSRNSNKNSANRNKDGAYQHPSKWRYYIAQFFIVLALILSAVWLLIAIWYQFGIHSPLTWLTTTIIVGLVTALLTARYLPNFISNKLFNNEILNNKRSKNKTVKNNISKPATTNTNIANINIATKNTATKWLAGCYAAIWIVGFGWFISIEPKQQREWQPDVSQRLSYQRDANNPNLITFTNVRNFDWHNADDATERWETRTIDMSKLSGVDVINSYWMGPLIAHTLVSFRFEDDRPLSLSLEIRKEKGESFSAIGGFFKRFELSLIAAEERDIIYTRTNARGEQVYLFPVSHLQQQEVKLLLESYLTVADELEAEPAWYNTLTSNCTNLIFYMARVVSGERLPWDYRIWVSGWLPNYLYDIGMLDASPENTGQSWSMDTWYERTHINPKVKGFQNNGDIHGNEFSMQIRQGIPIPPLAGSKGEAENNAKSVAVVSNE